MIFIDIRFIHVRAPHSGRALGDVLIRCLKDWSLDGKLSTLTLDNCSANDKMIEYILDDISHSKLILGGRIFHMRCCAHILNLVVKDGLSVISGAIEKVRKSVNYWTLTPKREEKFEDACLQLNCPFKKPVVDCKTRWNSIFLMLRVAIEYKAVYERLSQREKEYEDSPSEDEWKMAEEICLKLELFYDVTNLFSGRSYPTANVLFPKICEIKNALGMWSSSTDEVVVEMVKCMKAKFDKYWGVVTDVMVVGTLLDPRLKLSFIDIYFPYIYGEKSSEEIVKIKEFCHDLIKEYEKKLKGKEAMNISPCINPEVEEKSVAGIVPWQSIYKSHQVA